MKLFINSQAYAPRCIAEHTEDMGSFCIISTTDPHCPLPDFNLAHYSNCEAAIVVRFGDIDNNDVPEYPGISDAQADLLAAFIKTYSYVDIFYVNCFAGICRSSAVAAAASLYINGDDSNIFNQGKYVPNMFVYRKLLKSLGLDNSYVSEG